MIIQLQQWSVIYTRIRMTTLASLIYKQLQKVGKFKYIQRSPYFNINLIYYLVVDSRRSMLLLRIGTTIAKLSQNAPSKISQNAHPSSSDDLRKLVNYIHMKQLVQGLECSPPTGCFHETACFRCWGAFQILVGSVSYLRLGCLYTVQPYFI